MKLLPLACFAASAAQSGDYAYDSAVDDDRHYGYSSYGNYDDYGNSGSSNTWTFGGKAVGSGQAIARALNCWPANFDVDLLMAKDSGNANPAENHAFGPIHVFGSEKTSKLGSPASAGDPGLRAGMGGHYMYGHAHSGATWNHEPSEWVDYHSARHAGCLYEVPDFGYNAVSWERVFHLWYYNGYYDASNKATQALANSGAGARIYEPNWVHFFNSHVLISGGKGQHQDPTTQSAGNSIQLVMANPQYEGLGWLNFVATYGAAGVAVGSNYDEFADSTHITMDSTTAAGFNTYTAINNAAVTQQTQGNTGNYYYDAWMGTWELNMDTTMVWCTEYTETVAAGTTFGGANTLAISSFPHNSEGKDFRFNLRVLLKDSSLTNRLMYYFYKINSITVVFPAPVAYALVYDGRESNTASGAQSGGVGGTGHEYGDGVYNVNQNNIRDNIVPPLDLGSWKDYSFTNNVPLANKHHRIQGYLSVDTGDACQAAGPGNGCADFCRQPSPDCAFSPNAATSTCTSQHLEEFCSTKFHITGLLNTYSERLGGQRGSYQEIWIQLQYAMGISTSVDGTADVISSPFPYLHFCAPEITSITFGCDTINVDNGNTCNAFAEYGTHDFGFGG